MKRLFTILAVAVLMGCQQSEQQAKYVFYFIGDGMGLAQVALAEAWLADSADEIGFEKLSFTDFPVMGTATTFSVNNYITCSSAAGTALATGHKTANGMLGVTTDSLDLEAITYKIKKAGYRVGVSSTVTLDHATPGAFYANAASRSDYYDIAVQLPQTGFDFFGGGGFVQPEGKNKDQVSVLSLIEEAGYQIVYGIENFDASAGAKK